MMLLLGATVLLAACGSSGPTSTPGEVEIEGSWELVSGRGPDGDVPILDDHPITLTITGDRIGGTSACNSYGGRLVMRGGSLTVEDFAMTLIGCEDAVAASEAAYTAALTRIAGLARHGDELVLRGPNVELRFAQLPAPPTAELIDTTWVLETLFDGNVATAPLGAAATFELSSDGTFSGSTGCRSFRGRWIEQGERILATEMAMGEEHCAAALSQQDSHVVSVLGDGFVPTVESDLLTLTDPGVVGLVYRAPAE